jgi:hypothetical protein
VVRILARNAVSGPKGGRNALTWVTAAVLVAAAVGGAIAYVGLATCWGSCAKPAHAIQGPAVAIQGEFAHSALGGTYLYIASISAQGPAVPILSIVFMVEGAGCARPAGVQTATVSASNGSILGSENLSSRDWIASSGAVFAPEGNLSIASAQSLTGDQLLIWLNGTAPPDFSVTLIDSPSGTGYVPCSP